VELERVHFNAEDFDPTAAPLTQLSLKDWLLRWTMLTMAVMTLSRLASIIITLPSLLFKPTVLFGPVIAVTSPLFGRLDASWSALLRNGSLGQHAGGLVQLCRSFLEFTTITFKLLTLVPVLYLQAIFNFLCPNAVYFVYAGCLTTLMLTASNTPFPRHAMHTWDGPVKALSSELQALLQLATRSVQEMSGFASLEAFLLVLYGHSCFIAAMIGALTLFHAFLATLGLGLAWFVVIAVVPVSTWTDGLFFVALVLIPLAYGLRAALRDLHDAIDVMLPLASGLFISLGLNMLSDVYLVALANGLQIAVANMLGPLLPLVVPSAGSDNRIAKSYALGASDACYRLLCGDLSQLPVRAVGDVTPSTFQSTVEGCGMTMRYCQALGDDAVEINLLSPER
jgi:hypothetical protein